MILLYDKSGFSSGRQKEDETTDCVENTLSVVTCHWSRIPKTLMVFEGCPMWLLSPSEWECLLIPVSLLDKTHLLLKSFDLLILIISHFFNYVTSSVSLNTFRY